MVRTPRHPVVTFVRSRATGAGLTAGALVAAANLTLASERYPVPFNSEGAMVHGLPLLALLWGLMVGMLVRSPAPELEDGIRRVATLRLCWAATLMASSVGAAMTCTVLATAGSVAVAGRNAAAGVGLALISATLVGWRASWLPIIALAAPTFFWGVEYWTAELGEVHRTWALPLHTAAAVPPMLAAGSLAGIGIALYTWRDTGRWEL